MFGIKVILVVSAIFAYSESASITDNIKKCSIKEDECLRDIYRNLIQQSGTSGIPDADVPPIDPFVIKNLEVNALGMVKISMPDGTAKGFTTCRSTKFHTDYEQQVTSVELICDVFTIDGRYIVQSTSAFDALTGGIKVHGDGKCSLEIEKLQLNIEIGHEFKKLDDSELHVILLPDRTTYTFKILGKTTVKADNLYIGSQEVSAVAVNILNENWKFVSNSFGRTIVDKAIEVFMEYANKFFAKVPLKDLVTDDLSTFDSS